MKTFITLLLFIVSLSHTYSQPEDLKGSFLLGGSASFDYGKRKIDSGTEISFYNFIELSYDPTIAYFISNKINVGVSISSYQYFLRPFGETTDYNHSEIYLSGFIRYYPVTKLFFNTDIGIGTVIDHFKKADKKDANKPILGRVGIGYSWFINDHVIFEPKLHYAYLKYENINTGNVFKIENKVNFALSIMFILNKSK